MASCLQDGSSERTDEKEETLSRRRKTWCRKDGMELFDEQIESFCYNLQEMEEKRIYLAKEQLDLGRTFIEADRGTEEDELRNCQSERECWSWSVSSSSLR